MLFPELKFRGLRYSVDDRVKKKEEHKKTGWMLLVQFSGLMLWISFRADCTTIFFFFLLLDLIVISRSGVRIT
jgi:hypothetical protein